MQEGVGVRLPLPTIPPAGNLYGASGTALFKVDTSGTFTVLHTGDGSLAGWVRDAAGNLYGVNKGGGSMIYDRQGILRTKVVGFEYTDNIESALKPLL